MLLRAASRPSRHPSILQQCIQRYSIQPSKSQAFLRPFAEQKDDPDEFEGIMALVMDRPEAKNALSVQMVSVSLGISRKTRLYPDACRRSARVLRHYRRPPESSYCTRRNEVSFAPAPTCANAPRCPKDRFLPFSTVYVPWYTSWKDSSYLA